MGKSPEPTERPTAHLVVLAAAVPLLATCAGLLLFVAWWWCDGLASTFRSPMSSRHAS